MQRIKFTLASFMHEVKRSIMKIYVCPTKQT